MKDHLFHGSVSLEGYFSGNGGCPMGLRIEYVVRDAWRCFKEIKELEKKGIIKIKRVNRA
jgi:hypothetical protein